MFRRSFHSSCRVCCLAAIASAARFARRLRVMFEKDRWNLDRYRDERAVDIDKRLDTHEPVVKNPF